MPGTRSRQGCEECRRRRRKCDEQKPSCGQCSTFSRNCNYTLKLVWGGRKFNKSVFGQCMNLGAGSANGIDAEDGGFVYGIKGIPRAPAPAAHSLVSLPKQLPNGVTLSPVYYKLLSYFTEDILASLSCHVTIHEDLRRGLVPATMHSPQLMSACLALSAAGFLSRGQEQVDGVSVTRILGHLQSSGLPLLRSALETGQMNEVLLATCLIWCLADVFTYGQGDSSWRIHLQGIEALLRGNQANQRFFTEPGATQSAMRHLYQLYMSLQTLPYIPAIGAPEPANTTWEMVKTTAALPDPLSSSALVPRIDGFLGYSEELLHVLQQINVLSQAEADGDPQALAEAGILLGKVKAMIHRDAMAPPDISISASLSPEDGRDFELCHRIFQHATLVHLYRRLYHLPSGSRPIQEAVSIINDMVGKMTQGKPCHTWVAMAMPVFTVGCESYTEDQKAFVLDKVHKLEDCIGSLHVRMIRRALEDVWRVRSEMKDFEGRLCAGQLLEKLQYHIILF